MRVSMRAVQRPWGRGEMVSPKKRRKEFGYFHQGYVAPLKMGHDQNNNIAGIVRSDTDNASPASASKLVVST
jgi:hypothetical protein